MTIRQNVPNGAPCWVELMSSDPDRSAAFYHELLGWETGEPNPEFGGYRILSLGGEQVAGLMQAQPGMPVTDVWSVYLCVDDAVPTVAAARKAGSEIIADAMAVGDLGTMAVITDAGGAVIGMWQPGEHRGGVVATDNAPCHFELQTRDFDASVAFYETVFGWKPEQTPSDDPTFRYTVLNVADGENAGIMDATAFLPEGVPAHWGIYFAVPDVDATLATTEKLGGSIVMPAEDTPYGRLAVATDVNGATFKLRGEV